MKNKIYDCITFFNENFQVNLRFNILYNYVDKFVVCESRFDHKGKPKELNFKIEKFNNFRDKIIYIVLESQFPDISDPWKTQAYQREYMLENLNEASPDDYIFFSDPDEIPKPETLANFELKKKYGIFLQDCFNYKFNLFNPFESPWEGTRVAKKKNLRSIDFMRQKVRIKNLQYGIFRFDKEKNIQIFDKAGWHFNNIMTPDEISKKLKTFAHTEFSKEEFSSPKIIESKILKKIDLFNRGHQYKVIDLDNSFPDFLLKNYRTYKDFIL
jgi:beta-1,4-mannosyl-glycoprotein beta-1,4-N-acetylglucosaminyltransferase|tara:strand:- start:75 stop:884 length:810 start_codon:yes stop_codon:yes gene_type:complete